MVILNPMPPSRLPDASQEALNEVAQEYEKSLSIPETKPSPQWMLMPVGQIGAGKTTVVKPLSKRLSLLRISTDEIRQMLKERGYSYEGAREIAHGISDKYLALGYSLAIDANTGSPYGLAHNKRTDEAFPGVQKIFIHINPPEEFIIEKLRNFKHSWLYRDGEHAVANFQASKEKFVLPDLPFVFTFDPSRDDLEKQIEEGASTIESILHK